ncbi:MAG TPA: histidinol dehydrogenase [Solirubrobacterales bacterium]|jgi:sulfopropanediol 3-dehydrogenase|nr:histidinol dehydrogenase [Solirubrobacterales bacterium]
MNRSTSAEGRAPVYLKQPQPSSGSEGPEVSERVAAIIAAIRADGDAALRRYSAELDGWSPSSFRLGQGEIERLRAEVPEQTMSDMAFSQEQVRHFATAQRESMGEFEVETLPGVRLGQRLMPVAQVGAYVPGGRYPMVASAHMSATTAKVAGVERVVSCTPPLNGAPAAVTVAAMELAGADEIYVMGGVQAIAALALGTESIDPVDMVVGPGNVYVTEAKRQLFGDVGIDMIAGPTEILVIADGSADPATVATDLLSQAEHGPTSPAALITTEESIGRAVLEEIERQLATLATADVAGPAWAGFGTVMVVADLDQAVREADRLAYEHVEIHTEEPRFFLDRMHNYGALFLGPETTVAFGDKTIGTNHVLPTRGSARYRGGLWVGDFLRCVTYQQCTREGSRMIAEVCARQCRVEHFEGHARACDIRTAPTEVGV